MIQIQLKITVFKFWLHFTRWRGALILIVSVEITANFSSNEVTLP
jgi:hypothetical protein